MAESADIVTSRGSLASHISRKLRFSRRWLFVAGLAILIGIPGILSLRGWEFFQRPLVRVGFNRFPPYVDSAVPGGDPVGFAVEIFAQAARQAKIDIRWVEIAGSADRAFSEGKADMYPLMTITPEREASFYMSPPWWENQFALVSTEGREISDSASAKGKSIAIRIGVIRNLAQKLFPDSRFVDMTTLPEMEMALCDGKIDGFFSDVRLLQAQLMRRTSGCAGQVLHTTSVPDSKLFLGTASTKAAASSNDRIFREIAKMALDGTLSRAASRWGMFTAYDTARLKQVVDAREHETLMGWGLAATLLILALSVIQTNIVRRAKRMAESAQAQARDMQYRFDEFMKHTPAIAFIKDEQGHVVYSNEQFQRGQTSEAVPEAGAVDVISRQLCHRDDEVFEFGRGVDVTETLRGSDGINRHFLVLKFPFRSAAGVRFLGGVALDVTARILAEKELEYHAKSDLLTGLPNRRSFMAELELALGKNLRRDTRIAVGFVDLDGFKRVNDLMGHEAGDELLRNVAARLRSVCRESDMVARLGGDEFTFCLREVTPAGARQTMTAALCALEKPFRIGGKEVHVSASIGISLFPEHGSNSQQLLRNADSAMYLAKKTGASRIQFCTLPQSDPQPVAEPSAAR
jgi:diguanylate cyclase (GGDEF)-like protein/PAS domain S-box-containing protein